MSFVDVSCVAICWKSGYCSRVAADWFAAWMQTDFTLMLRVAFATCLPTENLRLRNRRHAQACGEVLHQNIFCSLKIIYANLKQLLGACVLFIGAGTCNSAMLQFLHCVMFRSQTT